MNFSDYPQTLLSKARAGGLNLALELVLAVAILYGLATKLILSLNLRLTSDSVVPGLMARDFWEYHNYLFADFYLPAQDTYFFTDVVPFHLVPQLLTGYDPIALKLTGYAIFLLLLAALSLLVYRITRNLTSALILAALGANINAAGYTQFATPNNHVATGFFCAVLLLMALYVNPVRSVASGKPGSQKKGASGQKEKPGHDAGNADRASVDVPPIGKDRDSSRERLATALAILLPVLTFLIAFSDTIAILWFVLPYVLSYIVFYKEKTARSDMVVLSMVLAIGAAYVLKRLTFTNVTDPNQIQGVSHILQTLPDYLSYLWYLLSPGITPILGDSSIGLYEAIGMTLLISVIGFSIFAALRNSDSNARFVSSILLLSIAIMAVTFVSSSFAGGLHTSRYLSFTAAAILIIVAMGYSGLSGKSRTIYLSLILVILAVAVIGSYLALGSINHEPNKVEYDLIAKLEGQGIDHSYGTYWTANVLTYLSGEEVIVRPVTFSIDGRVVPNYWNSCGRWYTYEPKDTYLIADNSTMDVAERHKMLTAMGNVNSTGPEYYSKYTIFELGQFRLTGFG